MNNIVPAILTPDFKELRSRLKQVEGFGARRVQIDVVDPYFVPGSSIGMPHLAQIRSSIDLEIHLMVQNPQLYIEAARYCNPKMIIMHVEPLKNPEYFATLVKRKKIEVGLALNPETSIQEIKPWVRFFSFILFLTIRPGRQGNALIPFVLEKIEVFKKEFPQVKIGVDGGWNLNSISQLKNLNVDEIVVGSGIWKEKDPQEAYKRLISRV